MPGQLVIKWFKEMLFQGDRFAQKKGASLSNILDLVKDRIWIYYKFLKGIEMTRKDLRYEKIKVQTVPRLSPVIERLADIPVTWSLLMALVFWSLVFS